MLYFFLLSCSTPKETTNDVTTNGMILEPGSESEDNIVQSEPATEPDSGNSSVNEENQNFTIEPNFIPTQIYKDCIPTVDEIRQLNNYQLVIRRDNEVFLYDELSKEETFLVMGNTIDSLVYEQKPMILIDGMVYLLHLLPEISLEPLPINEQLEVPIERMETNHSNLFLYGSGRFFVFYDDILKEISIQDEGYIYDFAFDSDGSLWLTTPNLIRLDEEFNLVEYNSETVLHDILYDGSQLWGFTDIQQVNPTENQIVLRKDEPNWDISNPQSQEIYIHFNAHVTSILGNPNSDKVWVATEESQYLYQGGNWHVLEGVFGHNWLDVDSQGRLWVGDGEFVCRYSIDRPVTIVDMLPVPNLSSLRTFSFLPSTPTEWNDIDVYWESLKLQTYMNPWRVEVNPNDISVGTQKLRFVMYSDNEVHISEADIFVQTLPEAGWEIDIQPIAEQRCLGCHSGQTFTNLSTAQHWENRFEDILHQVETQNMPPTEPFLTSDEILLLRGWREYGFLP